MIAVSPGPDLYCVNTVPPDSSINLYVHLLLVCLLNKVITVLQFYQTTPLSSKMPKLMQKIVLFIEPQEWKWETPLKIGNLFMNRFGIDEDGCHEIFKIYYLENTFYDYYHGKLTKTEGPDCIFQ